jgi:hypothetical protein
MRRRDTCVIGVLGRAWALGAATLLGVGCGPIEYIANVPLDASGAVAEAKHVGADKYAPYEYTAAIEYLHKARELAGFARFHSSVGFARKSAKLAKEGRALAIDKAALPEAQRDKLPGDTAPAAPKAQP